jgi:hypothetical protein
MNTSPRFLLSAIGFLCAILLVAFAASAQEKKDTKGPDPAQAKKGPPGNRGPRIPPTYENLKYGPYDDTVLDLWLAKSDKPTPVLVNIHGGGFRAGSKSNMNAVVLDLCLKAGISVASVEYRLSKVAQYPAEMHDPARAVQFLRYNAKKWNLDPTRFAATGGSAGAGISLWLAFHDDLADPKNEDPVLRESTRVKCAAVQAAQCTYDPRLIKQIIPGNAYDVSAIKFLFGLPATFNWDTDKIDADLDARLKDCGPISHLTKDDAPVWVCHNAVDNKDGNIHNANFGKYLKEQMDKVGIECVRHMDTDYSGGFREMSTDMFQWIKTHLDRS